MFQLMCQEPDRMVLSKSLRRRTTSIVTPSSAEGFTVKDAKDRTMSAVTCSNKRPFFAIYV